jgi:hypothetical protein
MYIRHADKCTTSELTFHSWVVYQLLAIQNVLQALSKGFEEGKEDTEA